VTAELIDEDGALPLALTALEDAVAALIEPINIVLDSQLMTTPSLYMQLRDAVTGEQANAGTGGGTKSRPPFWTDAFDKLNEIDTALEVWQPQLSGVPASVGRLRALTERSWRPQDCTRIDRLAQHVMTWAKDISALLFPERKFTLPNACPNCGKTTVYRPDCGGDPVRQPALSITSEGCKCAACKYVWGVERFEILAAAIRYDLKEGITGMTAAELIQKLSRVHPETLVVTTDSTAFRYITEFKARTVQARISNHHSLGPMVQRWNSKIDKGDPVSVIVLSNQQVGDEL